MTPIFTAIQSDFSIIGMAPNLVGADVKWEEKKEQNETAETATDSQGKIKYKISNAF